mmetsp:Transcript_21563/g.41173  ORF Transcript_21563/g.41173 Transcript_21563/m.41173 type:complete len:89 (-) Transcript_21563:249-515(-)
MASLGRNIFANLWNVIVQVWRNRLLLFGQVPSTRQSFNSIIVDLRFCLACAVNYCWKHALHTLSKLRAVFPSMTNTELVLLEAEPLES